jgi:hypothetical protein
MSINCHRLPPTITPSQLAHNGTEDRNCVCKYPINQEFLNGRKLIIASTQPGVMLESWSTLN